MRTVSRLQDLIRETVKLVEILEEIYEITVAEVIPVVEVPEL